MNVIHTSDTGTQLTPRDERRTHTTEALLDRAMEIAARDGLDALTLQGVAKAVGYVTTAVYRYFPSKDALIAALQRKAIADIQDHFSGEMTGRAAAFSDAAPPTRALAALLAAADVYLGLPETRPRSWHLVAILLGDPRPLLSDEESRRTAPMLIALVGQVEGLFAEAADLGAIDPGPSLERTLVFWSACHGALCLEKVRRIAPGLPPSRELGLSAVKQLLTAQGASPARLAAASRVFEKGK